MLVAPVVALPVPLIKRGKYMFVQLLGCHSSEHVFRSFSFVFEYNFEYDQYSRFVRLLFRFGHNETTWRPFVEQSSATTYAVFVPEEYVYDACYMLRVLVVVLVVALVVLQQLFYSNCSTAIVVFSGVYVYSFHDDLRSTLTFDVLGVVQVRHCQRTQRPRRLRPNTEPVGIHCQWAKFGRHGTSQRTHIHAPQWHRCRSNKHDEHEHHHHDGNNNDGTANPTNPCSSNGATTITLDSSITVSWHPFS